MNFRTQLKPKLAPFSIDYHSKIVLLGSCFSDSIGQKLSTYGFGNQLSNPFGVLFNPMALVKISTNALQSIAYEPVNFFEHQGVYRSWDFGSQLAQTTLTASLTVANIAQQNLKKHLQTADYLFLTLGSAWVYELINEKKLVANCHKMSAELFRKRLLSIPEIVTAFEILINDLQTQNPNLQIILTISPVRHLRDGFVENQQSKAILVESTRQLLNNHDHLHYFPSYEIMLDDLRDYRFYADDMLHPSVKAIDYIWAFFAQTYLSEETLKIGLEALKIKQGLAHRPLHENSAEHQEFKQSLQEKAKVLTAQYGVAF